MAHPRHSVGDKPVRPQAHRHPTDVQRPRDGRRRFMVRQHQHHPRPTCHFLGCRPLAGHLFQLGVLRRRGVDTVPLNEHAPPYQGGRAKHSTLCTAIAYSGH